jgi:hypothetical protein
VKLAGLILIVAAAGGLAIWRGVAMYRYTFHKRDL